MEQGQEPGIVKIEALGRSWRLWQRQKPQRAYCLQPCYISYNLELVLTDAGKELLAPVPLQPFNFRSILTQVIWIPALGQLLQRSTLSL